MPLVACHTGHRWYPGIHQERRWDMLPVKPCEYMNFPEAAVLQACLSSGRIEISRRPRRIVHASNLLTHDVLQIHLTSQLAGLSEAVFSQAVEHSLRDSHVAQ